MMNFKRWDRITGWVVFAIAAATYLLTMEPSSSLWDCAEFIATSYKLEVGHPPGAPLFMLMARIATMFAPSTYYVPHMVNGLNCLASAFCILFLFWSITHLARRVFSTAGREFGDREKLASLGAGVVGALAYTFTDTFWFSAVEGEVYALSSMFTALVVWLMLKWEEQADEPHSTRWIILIAYLTGLSIGVHLLNLLTIPALVFIYYFRKYQNITFKGIIYATLIALAILGFINGIIIPYTVYVGAMVDLFFVNTLGLPVNLGIVVFALTAFAALFYGVYRTHKAGRKIWNLILLSVLMILIGFSSYATVTIRAVANPPMNSNNPNNPHALLAVLNRDQYGARPLIYGPYYSAPIESYEESDSYFYDKEAKRYRKATRLTGYTYPSEFMHLFPRLWNSYKGEAAYKPWAAYRTKQDFIRDENGEVMRDEQGRALRGEVLDYGRKVYDPTTGETIVEPTFGENLYYFFTYQLNYMYWRYFLWNFVGRQDDIQAGAETITHGNWLSGIKPIDEAYLGPQEQLPKEMAENPARNTYFFLPFLLGLIGLIYHLNRDQRNFVVVMWLFVMMGIALVVYFNTSPSEPRERDYVYAGSFYAFSIWIGLGVLAIYELLAWLTRRNNRTIAATATAICLAVPAVLATENWDDHDRSGRTYARDVGYNYLMSVPKNAIVINYGDNDTFPLWYNQEVDGVRPDVRIMNSSYLSGDWYIDEMRTAANDAPPVPFSLPASKYTYVNDVLPVREKANRTVDIKELMEFIKSEDEASKIRLIDGTMMDYIPARSIALPVNKDNAIAAGIVKEEDRDKIVDTVFINISPRKSSLDKSEMMILDLLATFDWKRPISFTQVYMLQDFGLLNYLQFDGYAYRLVPILTPYKSSWDIGRIDSDVAYPLLMDTFRYGNIADPDVLVDYFTQYNISASKSREGFARVAKQLISEQRNAEALALLDKGLEVMPIEKIRFGDANTIPFIEAYYMLQEWEKGDALMRAYITHLIEHIEYYLLFDGVKANLVSNLITEYMDSLSELYYMAAYAQRDDIVRELNDYYRTFGYTDEELIIPGQDSEELMDRPL
ncbi:MAG: DUF2723 domain-containing protein [Rikenellaceae bacterium]|nr:DUF2723 domain-containing protein [Rikenellaceae bacterium]